MTDRPASRWEHHLGKAVAEGLRGCGVWPLQPHPCDLEPPWEEFQRDELTVWDCLVHGWETGHSAGFLDRLLDPPRRILQRGQQIVLPPSSCPGSGNLSTVVIAQFPEDETTIPKAEQFLRSLPRLHRPVAFEIVGLGPLPVYDRDALRDLMTGPGRGEDALIDGAIESWSEPCTVTQFVAHPSDARRIERQLLAHYPLSAVVRHDELDFGRDLLIGAEMGEGLGFASTLALTAAWCWPLQTFSRLDPDPLGVALAAMEDLGKQEWALLQVLFQPARCPWAETLAEAIDNPYRPGDYLLPDVTARTLREKFSSPLFLASIRLVANREDVARQLQGWATQFDNPPQAFGHLLEDGESPRLGRALSDRCTFRPGMILNVSEMASLVHLPGKSVVAERLQAVRTRTRPAVETADTDGVLIGENVHRGRTRAARLPARLRARHCYVAGASGTGKSTLLLNMILQDIHAGRGVGLLDPHGDLVQAVLRRIPADRVDDVILFDPADEQHPFALNILEAHDDQERERIVGETLMSLERYFPSSWGARLERILTFTLYTVLETVPQATLADVEQMLIDPRFQADVLQRVRNPRYRNFWEHEFRFMPKNAVDPVLNRLSVFLLNRTVRNIICQRHSAVAFDPVLNESRIFLANLSTGMLGEKIAGMFGSFLVSKIVSAAFRRARLPEHRRRPWHLYIDEFQAVTNLSIGFERILAEARKYKLVLAGLANQYVGQLSPTVRQAIFGNIGAMIVFRLGVEDAHTIAREMGVFTAEEILNLEVGEAIARAGGSATAFNVATYPEPTPAGEDPTAEIIARTRRLYTTPRQQVEQEFDNLTPSGGQAPPLTPPSRRQRRRQQKSTPPPPPHPSDPHEDDLVT